MDCREKQQVRQHVRRHQEGGEAEGLLLLLQQPPPLDGAPLGTLHSRQQLACSNTPAGTQLVPSSTSASEQSLWNLALPWHGRMLLWALCTACLICFSATTEHAVGAKSGHLAHVKYCQHATIYTVICCEQCVGFLIFCNSQYSVPRSVT